MVDNHSIVEPMHWMDNQWKQLLPMVVRPQNHCKTVDLNGCLKTIPFNGDGAIENH